MDAKFKKNCMWGTMGFKDDATESNMLPCFRRTFDSFCNYLLSFHCFVQLYGIYFGSGLTQTHAMKYDKHGESLTTKFVKKVHY